MDEESRAELEKLLWENRIEQIKTLKKITAPKPEKSDSPDQLDCDDEEFYSGPRTGCVMNNGQFVRTFGLTRLDDTLGNTPDRPRRKARPLTYIFDHPYHNRITDAFPTSLDMSDPQQRKDTLCHPSLLRPWPSKPENCQLLTNALQKQPLTLFKRIHLPTLCRTNDKIAADKFLCMQCYRLQKRTSWSISYCKECPGQPGLCRLKCFDEYHGSNYELD